MVTLPARDGKRRRKQAWALLLLCLLGGLVILFKGGKPGEVSLVQEQGLVAVDQSLDSLDLTANPEGAPGSPLTAGSAGPGPGALSGLILADKVEGAGDGEKGSQKGQESATVDAPKAAGSTAKDVKLASLPRQTPPSKNFGGGFSFSSSGGGGSGARHSVSGFVPGSGSRMSAAAGGSLGGSPFLIGNKAVQSQALGALKGLAAMSDGAKRAKSLERASGGASRGFDASRIGGGSSGYGGAGGFSYGASPKNLSELDPKANFKEFVPPPPEVPPPKLTKRGRQQQNQIMAMLLAMALTGVMGAALGNAGAAMAPMMGMMFQQAMLKPPDSTNMDQICSDPDPSKCEPRVKKPTRW